MSVVAVVPTTTEDTGFLELKLNANFGAEVSQSPKNVAIANHSPRLETKTSDYDWF